MHRMRFLLMVGVALILLMGGVMAVPAATHGSVSAQGAESGPIWWYAYGEGQLIAFSSEGQVNVLDEDARYDVFNILEIIPCAQSESQWGIIQAADGGVLRLTPEGTSTLISGDILGDEWLAGGANNPHPLLLSTEMDDHSRHKAAIYDPDTQSVTPLSGANFNWKASLRFSADDQFLRYASSDSAFEVVTIYEYDLAAGTERVIATADNPLSGLSPDRYGEHWLNRQKNEDASVSWLLIALDGTVTELATSTSEARVQVGMLPDGWWTYPSSACDDGACDMVVHTFDESEPLHLKGFDVESYPLVLAPPNPDYALVMGPDRDYIWELSADAEPRWIGRYMPKTPASAYYPTTEKRWWLVSLTDADDSGDQRYGVWDNDTREMVLEGTFLRFVHAYFSPEGFIVSEELGEREVVFRVSDQAIFDVGDVSDGLLEGYLRPEGFLYYNARRPERAVFRYDLESGEYHQLLSGAWNVCAIVPAIPFDVATQ